MLPNESFLVVLHFADYKTLVLAKLAGRRFLRLATTYAEELARHRRFRVTFHTSYISYSDVTIDERPKRIRYEPVNQASLAAACQEVADVIGPHAVSNLAFSGSTMIMDGVGAVFEAAPALKYAEDVDLYWPGDSTSVNNDPEAFMQNFAGMKTLSLSLGFDTFRQLSWSFLRKESARELRLIKVSGCGSAPPRPMDRSVEELVRCCVTLPHLQGGAPLELNGAPPFSKNKFTGPFGLQIIEGPWNR
ncbi:hypothetical protein AAVH_22831 [Aphelenchoides avenae]|nr:hypothetical protein AAVH_22831 [Aphelenchus avenae]